MCVCWRRRKSLIEIHFERIISTSSRLNSATFVGKMNFWGHHNDKMSNKKFQAVFFNTYDLAWMNLISTPAAQLCSVTSRGLAIRSPPEKREKIQCRSVSNISVAGSVLNGPLIPLNRISERDRIGFNFYLQSLSWTFDDLFFLTFSRRTYLARGFIYPA